MSTWSGKLLREPKGDWSDDGRWAVRSLYPSRAEKLHPSKKLTMEQLALVETLAIGCHANDRGAPPAGEHALIIGLGPIGLATLEFARLTDAQISVMDMNEQRLEFVRKNYGITNTIHFKADDSELNRMRELTVAICILS